MVNAAISYFYGSILALLAETTPGDLVLVQFFKPSTSKEMENGPPSSGSASAKDGSTCEGRTENANGGLESSEIVAVSVEANNQGNSNGNAGVSSEKSAATPLRADEQPTPCGLNRFFMLVVYAVYVTASARVLFGWPHLSNMLLHDGAYLWRCEGEPQIEGKRYACTRQDSSVQLLFTLGIGVSFCCSLAAGALLDWGGPKLTACVGQLFNTTGWIMMGLANEERQLYIPAVIFMAMGADAGYLPSMNIANLFPGYESLVIVGVCAAMSASFSVTSIMDATWKANPGMTFQNICFLYAGFGSGLCFFIALLAMPSKQYKSQEELNLQCKKDYEGNEPQGITDDDTELCAQSKSKKGGDSTFASQLWTGHFVLMFIYWPLNALFYNFYLTSAENLFGKDINDLIGILGPVSMVPSILLGFLADRWGVMALVLFIISSGVCMYAFTLMPFLAAHYLSPIFSCLYVSNFSGQMYAYVGDTFRSTDFGRVVGIISITGGLVGLLRIPLNDRLTLETFGGNYRYTCAVMLGVTIFCFFIALWLYFIKQKQQKAYITEEELQQQRKQTGGNRVEVELQPTTGESLNWA